MYYISEFMKTLLEPRNSFLFPQVHATITLKKHSSKRDTYQFLILEGNRIVFKNMANQVMFGEDPILSSKENELNF